MSNRPTSYTGLNDVVPFRFGKALVIAGIFILVIVWIMSAFPQTRWTLEFLLPLFALFFFVGLFLLIIAVLRYVYSKGSAEDGLWALKTGPLR